MKAKPSFNELQINMCFCFILKASLNELDLNWKNIKISIYFFSLKKWSLFFLIPLKQKTLWILMCFSGANQSWMDDIRNRENRHAQDEHCTDRLTKDIVLKSVIWLSKLCLVEFKTNFSLREMDGHTIHIQYRSGKLVNKFPGCICVEVTKNICS